MSIGHDQAATLLGSLSALVRATRAAAHRSSQAMGAAGTPVGVLRTLRAGDARPSDLAAVLHVAPSVVSRAIVPLVADGLVARTTDPADGRASLIGITPLGRRRLTQLQDAYVGQVSELLTDWTDGDAQQAATVLDRLAHALASSPTDLAPTAPPSVFPHLTDPADTVVDAPSTASTRKPVPA